MDAANAACALLMCLHMHCRHEDMLAVYNRHLLLSESPVTRSRGRQQHTPMPDTPRSGISSAYDLEDSFLAEGECKHVLRHCSSVGVHVTLDMHCDLRIRGCMMYAYFAAANGHTAAGTLSAAASQIAFWVQPV